MAPAKAILCPSSSVFCPHSSFSGAENPRALHAAASTLSPSANPKNLGGGRASSATHANAATIVGVCMGQRGHAAYVYQRQPRVLQGGVVEAERVVHSVKYGRTRMALTTNSSPASPPGDASSSQSFNTSSAFSDVARNTSVCWLVLERTSTTPPYFETGIRAVTFSAPLISAENAWRRSSASLFFAAFNEETTYRTEYIPPGLRPTSSVDKRLGAIPERRITQTSSPFAPH